MDRIRTDLIKINEGRRSLNHDKIHDIVDSIKELGLINPICITRDHVLVAGNHRLEAYKMLGIDEIPFVYFEKQNTLLAELAEIDENLIRYELTTLEEGEQLSRRKEIYEELYPETKPTQEGGKGANQYTLARGQVVFEQNGLFEADQNLPVSFTEDTSKKTGQSKRTVSRKITIFKRLEKFKDRLNDLDLAQHELEKLSKVEDKTLIEKFILIKEEDPEISYPDIMKQINYEIKEKKKTEKAEELKSQNFEPDINIYLGDCLNYINTLQDKSIDCLLTDPPYGENFQMNKYDNELSRKIENDESLEDALILLDDMLSRVKPKLKDNAHLYIFCSWKNFAEFKEVVSNHFKVKNALIWNKELFGMGDLKGNYADTYEMIIFAGGNREFVKRPGNIITCRFDEERLHNTQKPVDLLSELIENSTDAGDLIFDPFLGSGSTAVASKKLNRNYSGCELDEQNYKITLKRLADE